MKKQILMQYGDLRLEREEVEKRIKKSQMEGLSKEHIQVLIERIVMIDRKLSKIERFINEIDDSRIRRIISLKYIEGLTWGQVAQKMGSVYTEEGCRKLLERFLKDV